MLQAENARLREELPAALWPDQQRSAGSFAALQAQSAGLTLIDLGWVELPREGALQPVELALVLSGDPLNLPILVDGLFNLRFPVVIDRIELAGPRMLVKLRAWRPLSPGDWPKQQGLESVAENELLKAFSLRQSELRARSERSRKAVARALPGLVLGGGGALVRDGEDLQRR